MDIKKTRIILATILVVIISISTVLTISAYMVNATFASQTYVTKHLVTAEMIAECDAQLDKKYTALEAKTGIPARVFETIKNDYDTKTALNSAVKYIFNNEDSTLYSQDRVDKIYNYCIEYLDGNSIAYNKDNVMAAAQEAVQIYSDTVGIHNADNIKAYMSELGHKCIRVGSVALLSIVLCLLLLGVIYKKRNYAFVCALGGISGGAVATVLGALICAIVGFGSKLQCEPAVFQNGFNNLMRSGFLTILIVAAVVSALSIAMQVLSVKKLYREDRRSATKFAKIITKLEEDED